MFSNKFIIPLCMIISCYLSPTWAQFDTSICALLKDTEPPILTSSGLIDANVSTQACLDNCLGQGPPLTNMAIGLVMDEDFNVTCLCATDTYDAANLIDMDQSGIVCPSDPVHGQMVGENGLIAIYPLTVTPIKAILDPPVSDQLNAQVDIEFTIQVSFDAGSKVCSSTDFTSCTAALPPEVEIHVDYGDGSGVFLWTPTNPLDIFSHQYTIPGKYVLTVSTIDLYEYSMNSYSVNVIVTMSADLQAELICPVTMRPGEFFNCAVDLPFGKSLSLRPTITDDISDFSLAGSFMSVPANRWNYPGGPIGYTSYDDTRVNDLSVEQAFVLLSTQFSRMSNVSHIEVYSSETGTLSVDVVIPICRSDLIWCPLIKACDANCISDFQEKLQSQSRICSSPNTFCSSEDQCKNTFTCPSNLISPMPPISFSVIKSYDVPTLAGQTAKYPIVKEALVDPQRNNESMRTHVEVPFTGSAFLAIHCSSNCGVMYKEVSSSEDPDLIAHFSDPAQSYTLLGGYGVKPRHHAVRVALYEDRFLTLENKFFCEKPTEKTVEVFIENGDNDVTLRTPKITCQYPIMEILDLSKQHAVNEPKHRTYTVLREMSPLEDILAGHPRNEYLAEVWLPLNDPFYFEVQLAVGSHVSVSWQYENDLNDQCLTTSGDPCIFPFREDLTASLHYGCTDVSNICATQIDLDYMAINTGECKETCHKQLPRSSLISMNTSSLIEGTTEFVRDFEMPQETHLVIQRQCTTVGEMKMLKFVAQNEIVPDDNATLYWKIICSQEIVPGDWSLVYDKYSRTSDTFQISLQAPAGVVLPVMPKIAVYPMIGDPLIGEDISVDTQNPYYIYFSNDPQPDCTFDFCQTELELSEFGLSNGTLNSGASGINVNISIVGLGEKGIHGFAVDFWNGLNSIKYDFNNPDVPVTETITLLDPAPQGSGEWVEVDMPKWDGNAISVYEEIVGMDFQAMYKLPSDYGDALFDLEFVQDSDRWFLPASGEPAFYVSVISGTIQRVQFTFNNTDPNEPSPPPCIYDWPQEVELNKYLIQHCPNMPEGLYTVQISIYNPLDGWFHTVPMTVEILALAGPIILNDYGKITDMNEMKPFEIRLERAGKRTCITVDFNDGGPLAFFGLHDSCLLRYPDLLASQVQYFNHTSKVIHTERLYTQRGNFIVRATAFDARHFAETQLPITIFNLDCSTPSVYIARNFTKFEKPEMIPTKLRSERVEFNTVGELICGEGVTPKTYKSWRLYELNVVPDPQSEAGVIEVLTEIPNLNESLPSVNTSMLSIPALWLPVGKYKAVYKMELETYTEDIEVFDEAFTYFAIIKSPLVPVIIDGSATLVTRGWGQSVKMNPKELSKDPDFPNSKDFTFQWFCRKVAPIKEDWPLEKNGIPIYDEAIAQPIRSPENDPIALNPPPGCFGEGPGPLKIFDGEINLNTSSFITYAQTYEILLILSKDDREAVVSLEIEVGSIPEPIVKIQCQDQELTCFPMFEGNMVNPSSRLGLIGNCLEECESIHELEFFWKVWPMNENDQPLDYVFCEGDAVVTTTQGPTTTTTTTTTTTQPIEKNSIMSVVVKAYSSFSVSSSYSLNSQTDEVMSTVIDESSLTAEPTLTSPAKRRRKREVIFDPNVIGGQIPDTCNYVFGDGKTDARTGESLLLKKLFYEANPEIKKFKVALEVKRTINNGKKDISSTGKSEMTLIVNQPPENGTCTLRKIVFTDQGTEEVKANDGRALIDLFRIRCQDWVDSHNHPIVKYVFQAKSLDGTDALFPLYAGPDPQSTALFPVGQYDILAEIHDSRGAVRKLAIAKQFISYVPTQTEYEAFDAETLILFFLAAGDTTKVSQILAAQASIRQEACFFDPVCTSELAKQSNTTLSDDEINEMYVNQAEENTKAMLSLQDSINVNSLDGLSQGASSLLSLVAGVLKSPESAKTMDMEGRQAATDVLKKLGEGFSSVLGDTPITDPEQLMQFLEGISGVTASIIENVNSIVVAENPDDIPPSDKDKALSMPYDTVIDEGDHGFIPDSMEEATNYNILKLTKINAVKQVNEALELIEEVTKEVAVNTVAGESIVTKSDLGVKMLMTKLPYSKTIGRDIDGDRFPDIPLRFSFDDSDSVIQFPLGFCPGDRSNQTSHQVNFKCRGEWSFVVKEWDTLTRTYLQSSKNLNRVTKQLDIDVYDDKGNKVDISGFSGKVIEFLIERMEYKDKFAVDYRDSERIKVNAEAKLSRNARIKPPKGGTKRQPIIYHYFNASIWDAGLVVYFHAENLNNTKIILMLNQGSLPTLESCEFLTTVSSIQEEEGNFLKWFLGAESVRNRTGKWYLAVASISDKATFTSLESLSSCAKAGLDKSKLSPTFDVAEYEVQMYTVGCYFFNEKLSLWETSGTTIYNTTKLMTGCGSNHLTSFATGFYPEINTIDFDLVFASASFADNVTIYMFLILSLLIFFIAMIWAIWRDRKDARELNCPFMKDNHPDDNYMYEILVETGPLASHSTSSKVEFILSGDDEETDVRCFNDPDRVLFKSGAIDSFLMTTQYPLGNLRHMRVWTDSSGLDDNGAWYLLSISVMDVQTGKIWRFIADKWVAIDRGDFEDDVTLHAIDEDDEPDAYYLLKSGGNRKLVDEHIWWSVFTRPLRSRFGRAQRVGICMMMLMLCMLVSAMFYGTLPGRVSDGIFNLGLLTFDPVDIGIGLFTSIICFVPVTVASYLFRKSAVFKKRQSRFDKSIDEATKKGLFLRPDTTYMPQYSEQVKRKRKPWNIGFHVFAWILVVIGILGGEFMVFGYAVTFGNEKTYQWMSATISSFFGSMLIIYPLYILLFACLISALCRKMGMNDDHCNMDENDPIIYWDPSQKPARRKKIGQKPRRRKMDPEFREWLTNRKIQEMEMKTVIKDLSVYLLYVALVYLISYGNRDPNAFYQKDALAQSVVHGALNCGILPEDDPNYQSCDEEDVPEPYVDFMKVRDVNEWWYWVDRTLKPNVRVQQWYNGDQPFGLRGYLNDRVNRLIGYSIIRQVREEIGTCKSAKVIRDFIESCTGNGGVNVEDTRDYCPGWIKKAEKKQINVDGSNANCTESEEFQYTPAEEIDAMSIKSNLRTYSGGGYIFKLDKQIGELDEREKLLKEMNWIDNRTRALITEFSVYNAQVNLFGIVTITAEFIGGGIQPDFRIDAIRLFANQDGFGFVTLMAEILFVVATFYYTVNVIYQLKKQGCSDFFKSMWNVVDLSTVILSLLAIILWIVRAFLTKDLTEEFDATKGNKYIRMSQLTLVNSYFTHVISFTVFTSSLKFCKLLSFHRAFRQIAATIRLCFLGMATFIVEFAIVFCAFTAFFYFTIKNDLENFRDFPRSLANTFAMSIGKFNFGAIRSADVMAAWIFFIFSVVVNMILINMMMAIINMAFEDIKVHKDSYKNKFELVDYIRRTIREVIGLNIAKPIKPVYVDEREDESDKEEREVDEDNEEISAKFSNKTSQLLSYIESTYHDGFLENGPEGSKLMSKMKAAGEGEKKVMTYGFDALFMGETDNKQ